MSSDTATRRVIRTGIHTLRTPLNVVESAARQAGTDTDDWMPAAAFEAFEGAALQLAGTLVGDDELVEEGRLHLARAGRLRQAVTLRSRARAQRASARAGALRQHQAAEEQRDQLGRAADAEEAKVQERADRRAEAVAESDRRRRQEAVTEQESRRRAVARTDRAARAARIAREEEAVQAEVAALAAEDRAADLAVEGTPRTRTRPGTDPA